MRSLVSPARLAALLVASVVLAAPSAQGQRLADLQRLRESAPSARVRVAGFRATSPPPAPVRSVAEFEPAEAVLVSYPLGFSPGFAFPLDLIVAISQNVRVVSLVASAQQVTETRAAYAAAGVVMANTEFLVLPLDGPWVRDSGPMYVATGDRRIGLVDYTYDIAAFSNDDAIPAALGPALDAPVYAMDLVHVGGNYMTTGAGQAASVTRVVTTNDGDEALVRQQMRDYLGIDDYLIVPDPQGTPIDHIDTWAKFLDVDKVMIAQAAPGHPDYDALEAAAATFAATLSPWGTPYQVFRVFAPTRQPYANALIVNDHVYVPVMETAASATLDADALQAYRDAMPGYTVLGFGEGWGSMDALHCRTKEIADTGMLSVRHTPFSGDVPRTPDLWFDAEIIAYSGQPLLDDALHLVYRVGEAPYDTLALARVGPDTFRATLPAPASGAEVAYYLSASDASGRTEHFPLVGPDGPRTFRVGAPVAADGAPADAALRLDAAPNPAAGALTVRYTVATGGAVTVDVLDALGRRVARLADGSAAAGAHRATWDARGMAPGVYLVRLTGADGSVATQRVTVAR